MVAILASTTFAACGDNKHAPTDGTPVDTSFDAGPDKVARGRYIANTLGVCSFCHTPLNPDGSRNLTRLLAGWTCNDPIPFVDADPATVGVGCLSSRNLTNSASGLKNVTDQQIRDAIRNGTRTDGKKLVPIMPYWIFHNMTDDDTDAVIAYLRTVPGVDNMVPPNEPPWNDINDNNLAAPICNGGTCTATPIDVAMIPLPVNPPDMLSAMRGRYLASMVGLCVDCHTPDLPPPAVGAPAPFFPTPIDTTRTWAGGRTFPKQQLGLLDPVYPDFITTRNLTPHATGLLGYTSAQIAAAIAEGKDPQGKGVCAATHGSGISPYAALDPQDLTDIANYIAALPPIDNDTGLNCMGPTVP
ncbi:MAG: hypothetical protein NT062_26770 [Proteobacteria bacterium]|nr:hypothetical protein [Pseudomonadota bacterium]